jgi:anti-sigma B factor antagonist
MIVKVIQPQGILDAIRSNHLRQEIGDILASGTNTILIDLKDVSFMDSSGLSALVSALKMTQTAGGQLYLCSISEQVQIVFELTRMDRVFETFASQDDFYRVGSQTSNR